MLADRIYMRAPDHRPVSAVNVLIAVNIILFAVQTVAEGFNARAVAKYFYLSPTGLGNGYFWQLITFQFLHANLWHLAMNMVGLYMFGRMIESTLGRTTFLRIYLLSGLGGGVVQVAGGMLWDHLGGSVVGASAGVFGLIAGFAVLNPNETFSLYFIPFDLQAKWLLFIQLAGSIFGMIYPDSGHVAHAAHLGGMIMGMVYIRWGVRAEQAWSSLRRYRPPPMRKPVLVATVNSPRVVPWKKAKVVHKEELSPEEFITREVDPILDKINAHGINSLTERERKILEAARNKIKKK